MKQKILERKKLILFELICWAVYLVSFFAVERIVTEPKLILHSALDDVIPFVPYAVYVYILWFPYILITMLYCVFCIDEHKAWNYCKTIAAAMFMTLGFYLLVPNGVDIRPMDDGSTGLAMTIVRMIWASDTPYNVFPSIHVFVSILLDKIWADSDIKQVWKDLSHVLCAAICVSTVLLKQHSIYDVSGGMAVAAVCIYYIGRKNISADEH